MSRGDTHVLLAQLLKYLGIIIYIYKAGDLIIFTGNKKMKKKKRNLKRIFFHDFLHFIWSTEYTHPCHPPPPPPHTHTHTHFPEGEWREHSWVCVYVCVCLLFVFITQKQSIGSRSYFHIRWNLSVAQSSSRLIQILILLSLQIFFHKYFVFIAHTMWQHRRQRRCVSGVIKYKPVKRGELRRQDDDGCSGSFFFTFQTTRPRMHLRGDSFGVFSTTPLARVYVRAILGSLFFQEIE